MQSWLPRLDDHGGPKYAVIATAIEEAIRDGRLRPGERLPPQRDLARTLAVDLTTVTRAYTIMREAGLIEGAGRLGSYVRNGVALSASAGAAADTGMNMPPQPGFALLADAIRTGHAVLLRAGGQSPMLQYQPDGGSLHDRLAAAAAFTARGLETADDEVIVTAGGQNALHAILGATLARGDVICTGAYAYPGMLALAARFGLSVRALPGDAGGIDPDALAAAAGEGARALYIVPTNDNPTTVTLDMERRRAIAEVARRHGLAIIEDDAYGLLPAAPQTPIAALAPELTWHVASTSKIISPALRVAHVRAPTLRDAWRLAADVHETAVMAPPLNAALVSLWLRDGTFGRLIAAVREEAVARQRIVSRALAGLDYATHPEGYHLWLRLDAAHMPAPAELAAMLRPAGLSAVSAQAFAARPDEASPPAVRISFGGAMDHERLRRALQRLEALLHHGHARATALV
ncbi:PLP-dependent aminotransferase family protein [Sphingomonas quercus]|uniref:PLP-dependent aminotransferase family protein n=1 Tax=Sphingomonas quercus TaxID=2842451 RepID=A0ABS6BE83_9SPHN|nr:PLP-dependent aminotransferase family protein [Sphingomonas quercus]MBU3076625.1 PLP-dependent aminotransferase family protein [Sphingomonas quercus]